MLPDPNEPLRTADGKLIEPDAAKRERKTVEVPTHSEAQRQVTAVRRRLTDLPDVPARMNGISVVLSYTLFGLDDNEIALATGLTIDQVGIIKMSEAYASMSESLVQSIMQSDADDIRRIFRQNSVAAAKKITSLVHNDNPAIALAAAKDALDRDGHRPADVVEHRHKVEGGLVIEVVRKQHDDALPVIDVTPNDA